MKRPMCPFCGSEKSARILYGYPVFSEQLKRDLELGKVILGGCVISGNDPEWRCLDCSSEWTVKKVHKSGKHTACSIRHAERTVNQKLVRETTAR